MRASQDVSVICSSKSTCCSVRDSVSDGGVVCPEWMVGVGWANIHLFSSEIQCLSQDFT